jgi:hypothetical protein
MSNQFYGVSRLAATDLTLGMTKFQREEHARQQAIQASAQAKADGLD